jgi:NAD(P)H-hydrate repair Nnr-like enzyme with NAD(P)H-hydrate epimerase domain
VISRHLWQQRVEVSVYCLKKRESYQGDAKINLEIIEKLGVPIEEYTDSGSLTALKETLIEADLLVDAILGTGLKAPVRGFYQEVIDVVNFGAECHQRSPTWYLHSGHCDRHLWITQSRSVSYTGLHLCGSPGGG